MSEFVIKKPDAHKREYKFLQLDNGLKAVIGSDPDCDKAGASLCVNVGMCHERKDMPGLAHFLEHMLFTGTKKFPKEGEYHEFMQQNGGFGNAYTLCYFTNFMFEVKPDKLQEGLDRFSRFFYEPLFTKDCTDREINAVDSEFQGGMTSPWWRYIGIINQSANPEHPFHVACGNVKVLRDEPKERGVDLYEEMSKLYEKTYSANGMTLVIIGRESIDEMSSIVKSMFGGIPDKGFKMPIGDSHSSKPPFLPDQWNRLVLQNPVQDVKELTFTWVLPWQVPHWRAKPTHYISHLLGYEGAGSIVAVLKQKGLISGCVSDDGKWIEGSFSLLNVSFDLTEKGLDHIEEIGTHLFAYLGMLQKTPPQQWIFDEMKKLAEIKFKFQQDQHPFELCEEMSMNLQHLPADEVLSGRSMIYQFDPEGISSVLSKLTLEGVRVWHQAKTLADRCTEKDTSYGSPVAFLPLEASWRERWAAAASAGDAEALGLRLPKPNPFIPEDLSLRALPQDPPQLPVALGGCEPPLAAVFHRQDDALKQPKAHATFFIYSPFLCKDTESYVIAELWCRCVQESLNEYAYDAEVAGVGYSLSVSATAIAVVLHGFNDKLGVLLDAVLDKVKSMREIPETIYSIVADAYGDEVSNIAFHSPPYSQCSMRFTQLTSRGAVYPSYERHATFKGMTREKLTGVVDKLFHESGCHVEALVLGNVTPDEARQLSARLVRGLGLKKALGAVPERAEAVLPPGSTLWQLDGTDAEDPNNAVFVRIQIPDSIEADMYLRLLGKVLGSKFFEILRTQQQLGYICQLAPSRSMKFAYLVAVVQTEFPPDYARSRIDAFLDEHLKTVEESLEDEEFEVCRAGLLSELLTKHKTLNEEVGRYAGSISSRTYDFDRRRRAIDFVEKEASTAALRRFVGEQIQNAPRIYTQIKKTNAKEDKPLPEGASSPEEKADLRRWTTHQETVASFAKEATWLPYNTDIGAAAAAASRL